MQAAAIGTAAAAAMCGKEVFDYNRENFLYDRDLRLKKEFHEYRFRICQGDLWRQDIRDIFALVELKTKLYCLITMFLMGISIQLWVQGRLPQGTPDWLMLGNQVANVGAFAFLLLTVWLSMHASVSAQGCQARLLTQLIRLPIPTWEELEACRTYGSSFEKCEGRQLFRVPFLTGQQEKLIASETDPLLPSSDSNGDSVEAPVADNVPIDPWGMESRARDVPELGCPHGEEVSKLRHIILVRQASKFYQGYDAFARISMTIGVNQLIVCLCYYLLGYILVTDRAPWPAFAGIIVMIALSQIIAKLDMSLSQGRQLAVNIFIVAGPVFSCIACYHWGRGKAGRVVSDCLSPLAFFSHGILVLCLTWFVRLKETHGGGMLPVAFKHILFLDVFGWISRIRSCDSESVSALQPPPAGQTPESADSGETGVRTGLQAVVYNSSVGHNVPKRPEQFAPKTTLQDLRTLPGAPTRHDTVSNTRAGKLFFDASSFYPRVGDHEDSLEDDPETNPYVSGHDRELPGQLPYRVFTAAAVILGFLWILAGIWQILDATRITDGITRLQYGRKLVNEKLLRSQHSLLQSGTAEQLSIMMPFPHILPHGFSCDAAGENFAFTDGLSMFAAQIAPRHKLRGQGQRINQSLGVDFHEIPHCKPLIGESLDDTAIACGTTIAGDSSCDVLVLHRHGGRIAECPVSREATVARQFKSSALSQRWLETKDEVEKVAWLLLDSNCASASRDARLQCAAVATTRGRVAQLENAETDTTSSLGDIFPDNVIPDQEDGPGWQSRTWRPGIARAIGRRYLGVLQRERNLIQVLDVSRDLAEIGQVALPAQSSADAFCVGGGHFYFLSIGPEAQMWRLPVPSELAL
jgi:hypothetical protein